MIIIIIIIIIEKMLNLEAFSSPFELVQQEIMNEMTDGGPLGSHQESFQPLTAV